MNVAHLLVSQATLRPDAPAIIERSGSRTCRISFAELDDRSARCATMLAEAGIKPGDHVLVFVPMSIDLYCALIAVFRIGAVATFLDPSAGRAHIDDCCALVHPAAMIGISKSHLLRLSSGALRQIRSKFTVGLPIPGTARWERGCDYRPAQQIVPRADADAALVTFTSGSTGVPKAAVRSHRFLAAQHASLARAIELRAGEIDLSTLPIFSLANLASGVTSIIPDADSRHPAPVQKPPVIRQIVAHQPTRCVASPAFFQSLLAAPDAERWLSVFKRIDTGGAPVFPRLLERLQRAMPQARITAVYGSTEAEPIAKIEWNNISPSDLNAMFAGSGLLAGVPVLEINLRIVANRWGQALAPVTRAEFQTQCLEVRAPGEIIVQGEHVLAGYLAGRGDEKMKWRVDDQIWHRTGDAGYLDQAGRLWLLGRAEAKIQDEQGTIYPFAVECAATQNDFIERSALVQHHGVRLLVVQARRSSLPEIKCFVKRELAWAHIAETRFLARIPLDKRHHSKIDYPALRALLRK